MAKILVLYHSQQVGNTRAMAEAVAEGAREMGAEAQLVNTNEKRMSIEAYRAFDAVAIGSPDYYSYIAGGLKMFLDDWYIAKQSNSEGLVSKPYGLFYSHGGGGRVREPLEKLCSGLGSKTGKTVESIGKPDKKVLEACSELGAQIASALKK